MIQPVPNANISVLSGVSIHEKCDPSYQKYRYKWFEYPKKFIVKDFPIHLDIEATNRCNLKCVFCDKLPYLSSDQMGDMDFDMYKRIIDEGKEHDLCSVKLSYRGEPLLHSKLPEMITYAKHQGLMDVYFNTNGMLLSENKVLQLIDAGLDRISISVDGTDPEVFERDRLGASFNKIVKNVDHLMELRERKSITYPKIRIQTVNLPQIDLQEYAHFWKGHCDEVASIDYKEADEKKRKVDLIDSDWACPQLWQRMTIEWDGTIMPCNNDDYRKLKIGNVMHMTIKHCWRDQLVEHARTSHREGKSHLVEACNGCPWRSTQILKRQGLF